MDWVKSGQTIQLIKNVFMKQWKMKVYGPSVSI